MYSEVFEFTLTNVDTVFANALRRTLISDVPSCAFGFVQMITNTSSYGDEYVAHRIGLLPISLKPTFGSEAEQLVELYANCRVHIEQGFTVATYSLDISCDKDATTTRTCTTDDLVLLSSDLGGFLLSVCPGLPIVVLAPGQSIQFVAVVHFGTAKDHAKWSPVAAVGYKVKPQITISSRLSNPSDQIETALDIEDIVTSCPSGVFTERDGALVVANAWDCTLCRQCLALGSPNDIIINPGLVTKQRLFDVRMSIEPVGQMPAKVCALVAMRILQRKLQYVTQSIVSVSK